MRSLSSAVPLRIASAAQKKKHTAGAYHLARPSHLRVLLHLHLRLRADAQALLSFLCLASAFPARRLVVKSALRRCARARDA